MASSLPSASMSPQIINGVVEWYCNDSFTYVIQITLINPITQDRIMVQPDDQIQVSFYAPSGKLVHTFITKGTDLTLDGETGSQKLTLDFTEEVSHKFVVYPQDMQNKYTKYTYCIKLIDINGIHTIGANLEAKVRACH